MPRHRSTGAGSTAAAGRYVTRITTTIDGGGEGHSLVNRLGQQIQGESKNLDGSFSYVANSYNELGLVSGTTRPAKLGSVAGPATTWQYDPLRRTTARTRPEDGKEGNVAEAAVTQASATTSYSDFVTTQTDDFGREKHYTHNSLGQITLAEVTNDDGDPVPTRFTYGPFGVLKLVERQRGDGTGQRVTSIKYDRLGRKTSLTDPSASVEEIHYNGFGEIRTLKDGTGFNTTYIRDALGRVTERNDKDGKTTFTWDVRGKGFLASSTSSTGVVKDFFYDSSGRVFREITTIDGQSFQIDNTYDAHGRVSTTNYPASPNAARFAIKNTYDADTGGLTRVKNLAGTQTFWQLKSTKADGQTAQESFGNNDLVVTDYTYSDITGRPTSIKSTRTGAGSPFRSWGYDYWKDGNLRRRSDVLKGQHERFEYDNLDRIREWIDADQNGAEMAGGWKVTYTIDDFGNITDRDFKAGTATGGTDQNRHFNYYSDSDRLFSSPWGTYSYDGSGNQTARPGETIDYTAFSLPKTITAGSKVTKFLYGAGGSRARKWRSNTDYTIYVGGLYEKRVTGSAIDHLFFVMGASGVVAQVKRTEGNANDVINYLHTDRLGSLDAVTDGNGNPVGTESFRRDPYGNRVTNFNQPTLPDTGVAGNTKVHFGFTGQEQDDDLGLINMRGRMYDPRLGQFLSADPMVQAAFDGQSHNRFAYVFNNPLNAVDPTGLCSNGKDHVDCHSGHNKQGPSGLLSNPNAGPPPWSWARPPVTRGSPGAVNPGAYLEGERTYDGALTPFGQARAQQRTPGAVPMSQTEASAHGFVAAGFVGNPRVDRDGHINCDEKDCAVWGLTEEGTYVEFGHWGDRLIPSALPYSYFAFRGGVYVPWEMIPTEWSIDGKNHQVIPEPFIQGSIGQAIVETIVTMGVMGVVRGGAAVAEEEVFYRAMTEADFELMLESGQLPATGETFISPTQAYSEMFDGILVEFRLEAGTTKELAALGVSDGAPLTASTYPGMSPVFPGWGEAGAAFFKMEGTRTLGVPQINIGLGRGAALNVFNSRMMRFDVVRP